MLLLYYVSLKKPLILLLSYIIQVVPYCLLLRKLGVMPLLGLLPNVAEYKMTRKVYPKKRTFFRPFILAAILLACSYYAGPYKGVGIIYLLIAFVVYGIFLIRVYIRLAKAFGRKIPFYIGLIVLPPVFLALLALGKSEFTAPVFKPEKQRSKPVKILRKIGFVLVSALELLVIIAGCGFYALQQNTPAFIIEEELSDVEQDCEDVGPTGSLVTREDVLGSDLTSVVDKIRSRDYFCADHSKDQNAIVFVYMIGSDLEGNGGMASLNVRQMIETTKQGTGLKYIMEAGGSTRWFTDGIENGSYGRYEIADGKITKLEELDSSTNMAKSDSLADFLAWAKENYNADRNILVLWDHGGGVVMGYGSDSLNGTVTQSILASDFADALKESGMTFDIIGFDACLMQDIEVANALAPYADYFIASEETECGCGWYYTSAFGDLAKNPGMSSEELGKEIIACYDPYNSAVDNNNEHTEATLSLVDLTLVGGAYDNFASFLENASEKITSNPDCFADVSLAAANARNFNEYQIDLIGFLNNLDEVDYNKSLASEEEIKELIQSLQASIVCRNGASAEGINGIAFAFPYTKMQYYTYTSDNLQKLSLSQEKYALDVIFSIMAAQQAKTNQTSTSNSAEDGNLLSMVMSFLPAGDYTTQSWYIEGFEDYDDAVQYVDIPLTEVSGGYQVELPSSTWNSITDVQTMVYQQLENDEAGAVRRYIGNDYLGDTDENGHNLIAPDSDWVHVDGQLVCYESDQVSVTDDGNIYTGKIKARLNDEEDIYIMIEWDPEVEGQQETAHILGYTSISDDELMPDKGYDQLVSGDSLQFLFDYYDAEGNYLETRTDGNSVRVTNPDRLKVEDAPMDPCTIEFGGLLNDVYGRIMTTEMVEVEITNEAE